MEYVNINTNYNKSDRPRTLTNEEVDVILDSIPNTFSADPTEGRMIREALQMDIREALKYKKLAPSALPALVNEIVKHHNTSRIAPGFSVGSDCASSSCHASTQAQLNSFTNIGASKSGSSGVGGTEYLLYCKKHREVEVCTIHYKDKTLTYEQVLDTKKDIVGCVMIDLMKDYLYTKQGSNYVKDVQIETYENLSKKWWHTNVYYINNVLKAVIPPPDAFVLRIHFDLTEMYKFKVSLKDIVDAFKRENNSPIHLLYGPNEDAFIDIYACADYVEDKKGNLNIEAVECGDRNDSIISAAFYQTILLPSLETLRIKGVSGIKDLVPIVTPVVSVIVTDQEVAYYLKYDMDLPSNVIKLFDLLGIKVKHRTDTEMLLLMPDYVNISHLINIKKEAYLKLTPKEYIEQVILKDKKDNPKSKQTNLLNTLKVLNNIDFQRVYVVVLNQLKMKMTGIDDKILTNLFNLCNINIVTKNVEKLKNIWLIKSPESPRSLINKLIKDNPKLQQVSEVIHSEVTGSNLRGLLNLRFLDHTRTTSNNIHILSDVLGVRASKTYYVQDLYQVMSQFGVHPQHILLIADVFYSKGQPTGAITMSGNKQLGPIDKATVSKAVDIFKTTAMHGSAYDLSGMTTHIAFGVAPRVGTGYFDIGYDLANNKVALNQEVIKAFKNEQSYIDMMANETRPVLTNNTVKDLTESVESKEVLETKNISSKVLPKGRKVELNKIEEPVITTTGAVPVSKYQKRAPNATTIPVSKYTRQSTTAAKSTLTTTTTKPAPKKTTKK